MQRYEIEYFLLKSDNRFNTNSIWEWCDLTQGDRHSWSQVWCSHLASYWWSSDPTISINMFRCQARDKPCWMCSVWSYVSWFNSITCVRGAEAWAWLYLDRSQHQHRAGDCSQVFHVFALNNQGSEQPLHLWSNQRADQSESQDFWNVSIVSKQY